MDKVTIKHKPIVSVVGGYEYFIEVSYKNYKKTIFNVPLIDDETKLIIEKEIELYEQLETLILVCINNSENFRLSEQPNVFNKCYLITIKNNNKYFIGIDFDKYTLIGGVNEYKYEKVLLKSEKLDDIINYSDEFINMSEYFNINDDIKIALK